MKNKYIKNLLITMASCAIGTTVMAQIPEPHAAHTFNDDDAAYKTQITDISGKNNHAYWENWDAGTKTMYAGFRPSEGKFGGAWYMSGYHVCCEEMATSSLDFILFSGNKKTWDHPETVKEDNVYFGDKTKLTVMFWFKSDREFQQTHTPCPPDAVGMHEKEVLFSMGASTGLILTHNKGTYKVIIGDAAQENADNKKFTMDMCYNPSRGQVIKEWQHIALTFDGATGELALYLDGELATVYNETSPNPLPTGYALLPGINQSVELGAQNAGGLDGDVTAFWDEDQDVSETVYSKCSGSQTDPSMEYHTKYRTGWPAAGYFDEYLYYHDIALTQDQIKTIMNDGIDATFDFGSGTNIAKTSAVDFAIAPNPATNGITFTVPTGNTYEATIYSITGKKVWNGTVRNGEYKDISTLLSGLYMVGISGQEFIKLQVK